MCCTRFYTQGKIHLVSKPGSQYDAGASVASVKPGLQYDAGASVASVKPGSQCDAGANIASVASSLVHNNVMLELT